MPRVYGERIMLREYQKEDLTKMRKWVNDPVITDNLSDNFLYPHTVNDTEAYLNAILEGKTQQKGFVIAHKESGTYIGQIDLYSIDWRLERFLLVIRSKWNGAG